jgi:hypothetical protein
VLVINNLRKMKTRKKYTNLLSFRRQKIWMLLLLFAIAAYACGSSSDTEEPPYIPPRENTYYTDGEVLTLLKAKKGPGINAVIIGDGFNHEDLHTGGFYEKIARTHADMFLRMPVIRDHTDYFNVYIYMAESKERGVSHEVHDPGPPRDNKFHSHNGGYDYDLVKSTVKAMSQIGADRIEQTGVIFIANGHFGGYAIGGGYGFGVAAYPLEDDGNPPRSSYWTIHEFAGHIIGALPDQYGSGPISENTKKEIDRGHAKSQLWNVDYKSDPEQVRWKEFLKQPMYEGIVGIYPGAFNGIGQGIYNPETKTCMRDNPWFCFDAPSRYQIWQRIKMVAGEPHTLAEFFAYDVVNIKPYTQCSTDPAPAR